MSCAASWSLCPVGPSVDGVAVLPADPTAVDPKDPHFDPKSTKDNNRWSCVDIEFVRRMKGILSLHALRANPKLKSMQLVCQGRLSVQKVTQDEWDAILDMEREL